MLDWPRVVLIQISFFSHTPTQTMRTNSNSEGRYQVLDFPFDAYPPFIQKWTKKESILNSAHSTPTLMETNASGTTALLKVKIWTLGREQYSIFEIFSHCHFKNRQKCFFSGLHRQRFKTSNRLNKKLCTLRLESSAT